MNRVYVTLDTEMDADIHWKKRKPVTFSSVLEGIPDYFRPIWNQYNVHPIYFVSPEVVENEECCVVLREEIRKGALIGAHLHPEYIEPQKVEAGNVEEEKFPCFGYDKEVEKEKIQNLKKLIKEKLDVDVEWYRAARYGTDAETIDILGELGFKYDSSFTPCISWKKKGGPDHSKTPLHAYQVSNQILEVPITITGKRWGILGKLLPDNWLFYKWLRPTHMTLVEEKALLRRMKKNQAHELVMMFHSMEIMINKTPFVRTKWMQKYFLWKLRKTLEYARKLGYEC